MLTLLSLLAAAVAPPAAATPCSTPIPECTEWITPGPGLGRSLVYRSFPLSQRNESITRVFVMIHGAGRNADDYFRSAMAAAFLAGALETTLVIAPRMASHNGQNCRDPLGEWEISWNCSTWRSGGPALNVEGVTSFDFLDQILRTVARKEVFPNLVGIVVAGHSAGGQVVNRYGMSNRVHDGLGVPVRYIVSNPSSYAWPSAERPTSAAWSLTANAPGYIPDIAAGAPAFRDMGDGRGCTVYDQWPYGFQNRSGYSADQSDDRLRAQLAGRPVTYLLGDLDILPLAGFDGSCGAMAQGPTRMARGEAYARYVNERLGGHHEVRIVPLCGHNARCIFTSDTALELIFPTP